MVRIFGLALLAVLALVAIGERRIQAAVEADEPSLVVVFDHQQDGFHTVRIPALINVPAPSGAVLLAFCEGRKDGLGDSGDIDLVLKRSVDGGRTWGPLQIVADAGRDTIGNPCPVYDAETGTLLLLLTGNQGDDSEDAIRRGKSEHSRRVYLTRSTDTGETWSELEDITDQAKAPGWGWYATGPGVGIQLANGRLVIPCDHNDIRSGQLRSHVIYSDDHGATWQMSEPLGNGTNECQVVERTDGQLLLNMRSYAGKHRRAIATSDDRGETWSDVTLDDQLIEPVCQASLIRYSHDSEDGKSRLLFSNPASTKRENMTVRLSYDEGESWPVARLLDPGFSGYSCLAVLPDGDIGCLYEQGGKRRIVLARFSLAWLTEGREQPSDGE